MIYIIEHMFATKTERDFYCLPLEYFRLTIRKNKGIGTNIGTQYLIILDIIV